MGLGVQVSDGVKVGLGVKVSVGCGVRLGSTASVGRLATLDDFGVHAEKRRRSVAKTIAFVRIDVLAASSLLQLEEIFMITKTIVSCFSCSGTPPI